VPEDSDPGLRAGVSVYALIGGLNVSGRDLVEEPDDVPALFLIRGMPLSTEARILLSTDRVAAADRVRIRQSLHAPCAGRRRRSALRRRGSGSCWGMAEANLICRRHPPTAACHRLRP